MSKKTDIEAKILEVAYKLFLKQGYKNTTMDDLAQELGMSKKTLYKYFPGKMELLATSFDILKNKLSIKVETVVSNKYLPFTSKLKSLLSVTAKDLAPINSALLGDLRDHAPLVWEELQNYIKESAYLRFQRLMQEGIENGQVMPHVNVNLVVFMYASAIQNLIDPKFLSQFPKEMQDNLGMTPGQLFDQVIQVIYQGVLSEDARKEFQQA